MLSNLLPPEPISHNNINTWSIKSIEDYATAIAIIRNLTTAIKIQGGVLLG
jgi:hypothetical protein